jgi:hypothetical protein
MNGPLHRFFAADHRRLDALLRRAVSVPGRVDLVPFGEFRAGILKHIGMEEKVLFPAARHAREAPLVLAGPPARGPRRDRGPAGADADACPRGGDRVGPGPAQSSRRGAGRRLRRLRRGGGSGEAERLVQELRAFPEVPLKAYNDGPAILAHIQETLELSRRQWLDERGRT